MAIREVGRDYDPLPALGTKLLRFDLELVDDQAVEQRCILKPATTFLNRLLALTIELQNTLFSVFEDLLRAKVEGAVASGTYPDFPHSKQKSVEYQGGTPKSLHYRASAVA